MVRLLSLFLFILSFASVFAHPAASQQAKKGWFYGPVKVGDLPTAYVELSGLATAFKPANKNYVWAIEDGANPHIIAINRNTAANAGKWVLTGASVTDVEECGSVMRGGVSYVYLLDSGDNGNARATFKIFRIKEPTITGSDGTLATGTDWEEIVVEFPAGNIPSHKDVEAAIVDPLTGDLFVVTKRITPAKCYKLPWQTSYTGTQTLTYMGNLTADATFNTISTTPSANNGYATGGCISPNGTEILVRSYDKVSRFLRNPSTQTVYDALATAPTQMPCATGTKASGVEMVQTNGEPQGEAICFDASGLYYYTCSEYNPNHGGSSSNYPLFKFSRALQTPTTYTFQQGVSSYTGTTDTSLDSSTPTVTTGGTATTMTADYDYSAYPTISRTRQGLLKFDLSSIPTDQVVIQAYMEGNISNEGLGFKMHKIFVPWTDTDSWNSLTAGIATDGFDAAVTADMIYGPTPVGQGIDAYTGYFTANLNVATIQGWVSSPATNYGWVLTGPDESSGDGLQVASEDAVTAGIRPKLVVVTTPPPVDVELDIPFAANLLMDLNPSSISLADGATANGVWQDSSSANNDMTLETGPTYETSELNGYPAVRFDNLNDAGYSALNLTKPYTIYVLEKPVSSGLVRTVNSQSINALIANGRSGLQGYLAAQVAGTSIPTLGKVTYGGMIVPSTGTASFFQDGRDISIGTPAAVADWGTVTLGYNGLFLEPADTDLYRVLIYSTAHTAAERLEVETYFAQRYNLKLVDEGFEGVGTPVRWYVSGASFDYATAPAPLVGTESLRFSVNGQYAGINAILNHDELWGKFRLNVTTLPSSDYMELFKLQDVSEYTSVLSLYVNAAGSIHTNSGSFTTDVMTAGTSYWVYWHYKHVAGTNLGTQEVAFSTTESRPTSGAKWSGDTTYTTGGRAVTFQFATSLNAVSIVDQVQVSTLPFD